MPETLKEWYEWAQKLDWQYRQEQTESKLLGHSHVTHKTHKTTGGGGEGHERAQAQAAMWAQPLANTVTPNTHAPLTHQHQPQTNSDAMDVDRGGETSSAQMLYLWKIRSYCRNTRQIRGGDDLGRQRKGFCGRVPMKVSSLETTNKFNVLTMEETQDECFLKPKTKLYSSYLLCFQIHFKIVMRYHFDHKNLKINTHQK